MRSSGALFRLTERAAGDFLALVDADAAPGACSVPTAITAGFSPTPRAKAQAFRFPW